MESQFEEVCVQKEKVIETENENSVLHSNVIDSEHQVQINSSKESSSAQEELGDKVVRECKDSDVSCKNCDKIFASESLQQVTVDKSEKVEKELDQDNEMPVVGIKCMNGKMDSNFEKPHECGIARTKEDYNILEQSLSKPCIGKEKTLDEKNGIGISVKTSLAENTDSENSLMECQTMSVEGALPEVIGEINGRRGDQEGLMEYRQGNDARDCHILLNSDTSCSSSSDSSSDESGNSSGEESNDAKDRGDKSAKTSMNKARAAVEELRTKGEIFPEELPPIEELKITVDENVEMMEIGKVTSIVGILVVVQSKRDMPALNDDTVLFLEGRKVLGQIFEVFGPVPAPFYSVRFNSLEDIKAKDIEAGLSVFCAPKVEEFTHYIFVEQLKKIKGSDASWENNNEPPHKFREFSDDEEEKRESRVRDKPSDDGSAEPGAGGKKSRSNKKKRQSRDQFSSKNGNGGSDAVHQNGHQKSNQFRRQQQSSKPHQSWPPRNPGQMGSFPPPPPPPQNRFGNSPGVRFRGRSRPFISPSNFQSSGFRPGCRPPGGPRPFSEGYYPMMSQCTPQPPSPHLQYGGQIQQHSSHVINAGPHGPHGQQCMPPWGCPNQRSDQSEHNIFGGMPEPPRFPGPGFSRSSCSQNGHQPVVPSIVDTRLMNNTDQGQQNSTMTHVGHNPLNMTPHQRGPYGGQHSPSFGGQPQFAAGPMSPGFPSPHHPPHLRGRFSQYRGQ